jgi:hypothetical protein
MAGSKQIEQSFGICGRRESSRQATLTLSVAVHVIVNAPLYICVTPSDPEAGSVTPFIIAWCQKISPQK